MNNTSLYAPIYNDYVTMVEVQFHDACTGKMCGKPYTYKADGDYVIGQTVIVQAYDWYQVATITDINVPIPVEHEHVTFKWVVCAVDFAGIDIARAEEQTLIKKVNAARVTGLRTQMQQAIGVTLDDIKAIAEGKKS